MILFFDIFYVKWCEEPTIEINKVHGFVFKHLVDWGWFFYPPKIGRILWLWALLLFVQMRIPDFWWISVDDFLSLDVQSSIVRVDFDGYYRYFTVLYRWIHYKNVWFTTTGTVCPIVMVFNCFHTLCMSIQKSLFIGGTCAIHVTTSEVLLLYNFVLYYATISPDCSRLLVRNVCDSRWTICGLDKGLLVEDIFTVVVNRWCAIHGTSLRLIVSVLRITGSVVNHLVPQ